jgi:ABC-type glutathione transport system ATPase component
VKTGTVGSGKSALARVLEAIYLFSGSRSSGSFSQSDWLRISSSVWMAAIRSVAICSDAE